MRKSVIIACLSAGALITTGFKREGTTTLYVFPKLTFLPTMPTDASNPVTKEGVALGRYLFYDPILSVDSDLACANCHKQTSAFSDGPNKFSKGFNGEVLARNTLSLFNLAWYPTLFWDGRAKSIEEQVFHPVRANNEMNLEWIVASERIKRSVFYRQKFEAAFGRQEIDSTHIAMAIAQFERTIISYRSKYDSVLNGKAFFTKDEYAGFVLVNDMTRGDCLLCHNTDGNALGTIPGFSNNGLDAIANSENYKDKGRGDVTKNVNDNGKFKVPSLRNLAFTAPYMHDGRFKTLDEVLDFYSNGVKEGANVDSKMEFAHNGGAHFTEDEKRKIKAFLLTMSDEAFIKDPQFSNPFLKKSTKK